jgi:predicted dehydrogenase
MQFHNDEGITLIADATKLASQGKLKEGVGLPQPPLYYALADFLRSVLEQQPVVCPAEEGLRAAAVGILANQAVLSGESVTIDEALLRGA